MCITNFKQHINFIFSPDSLLVLTSVNHIPLLPTHTFLPPNFPYYPLVEYTGILVSLLLQLMKAIVTLFSPLFLDSLCSAVDCRHKSGTCSSFLPFLSYFFWSFHLSSIIYTILLKTMSIIHLENNHRNINTLKEIKILKAGSSKYLLNYVITGQNDPIYELHPTSVI